MIFLGTLLIAAVSAQQCQLNYPAGQWSWVQQDANFMVCGDGSATGYGIYPGTNKRLTFLLQGGGACRTWLECFGPKPTISAKSFGQADFDIAVSTYLQYGIFKRSDAGNPFANDTIVFVPYCSGDLWAGNSTAEYAFLGQKGTFQHRGYSNFQFVQSQMQSYLDSCVDSVTLAGDSAGGFGAFYNAYTVSQKLPSGVNFTVINDSGSLFAENEVKPKFGSIADIADTGNTDDTDLWGLYGTLPPDCVGCIDSNNKSFFGLWNYYAQKIPQVRIARIQGSQDSVMSFFLGVDGTTFERALDREKYQVQKIYSNAHYFILRSGSQNMLHTWLYSHQPDNTLSLLRDDVSGAHLATWLNQEIIGGDWGDVGTQLADLNSQSFHLTSSVLMTALAVLISINA